MPFLEPLQSDPEARERGEIPEYLPISVNAHTADSKDPCSLEEGSDYLTLEHFLFLSFKFLSFKKGDPFPEFF